MLAKPVTEFGIEATTKPTWWNAPSGCQVREIAFIVRTHSWGAQPYLASVLESDSASDSGMPMRPLSAMRASGGSDFSQNLKSKYNGYRKFINRTGRDECSSARRVSSAYPVSTSRLPMLDSMSRTCGGVNMRFHRPMVLASVSLPSPRNEEFGLCTDPSATCWMRS